MRKRIFSALVAVLFILALCPAAFAASETYTDPPVSKDIPVIISATPPENYYASSVKDGKANVEGPGFTASADTVPDGATRLVVVPVTEDEVLEWFGGCLPSGWGDTGVFYAVWFEDASGNRMPADGVKMEMEKPSGHNGELNVYTLDPTDEKAVPADKVAENGDISFETNGKLYYGVVYHFGRVDEETEIAPGAPETTLDMTPDELADAVFTDEDRKFIEDGVDIRLKLTVEDITNSVSDADKRAVRSVANGYSVGEYIDIELLKRVGDRDWVNIHETKKAVRITVKIPEKLLGVAGRTFAMVRVHGDGAQFLDDLDDNPETITFDTDEFSTYAILYKDKGGATPTPGSPQTGDSGKPELWFALAVISLLCAGAVIVFGGKKKSGRE